MCNEFDSKVTGDKMTTGGGTTYNGKMKEFKWRPGIFQKRINEWHMKKLFHGSHHDERFERAFKRLYLFAELEKFEIQPPCHWNYSLIDDQVKIELMSRECPCGINTDDIHYMDMSEFEFHGETGSIMFTPDHDVDFGLGGFYEIEMWTEAEEKLIWNLLGELVQANHPKKVIVKKKIESFIDSTMNKLEQNVKNYLMKAEMEAEGLELCYQSRFLYKLLMAFFYFVVFVTLLFGMLYQSFITLFMSEKNDSKTAKKKMSRQQRIRADAKQAAKDAEEGKVKQPVKNESDSFVANQAKSKRMIKTHFRKSQKPARL